MKAKEVAKLARKLMDAHGLDHVPFRFSRKKTAYGSCRFRRKGVYAPWVVVDISLSKVLLPYLDDEEVKDTILHEIAHALAGKNANHGPEWRNIAREVGATPKACHAPDMETLRKMERETSKYKATCECPAKHVHYFNRMGKHWQRGAYRCPKGKRYEVETIG